MEAILECPVCIERFDRVTHIPLVLLCGHTLCKSCAADLRSGTDVIVCPLDKKQDRRPLIQISHSYHILELIEHISHMSQTLKYLKLEPSERLEAMRQQAKENFDLCQDHLEKIQTAISEISSKRDDVLSTVSKNFSSLKDCLENKQQELENEVSTIVDEYIEKYEQVKTLTQVLYEKSLQKYEELMVQSEGDTIEDVKALTQLPELPVLELKLQLVIDTDSALNFIKNVGRIGKINPRVPYQCSNYSNVTYWMVPPCCYKHYCCNKCHDAQENHSWSYAGRMVCMFCDKEQDYRKLPNHCEHCNSHHKGVVSRL
ncbi:unnamed protein product [Blepharisma stoltei]|uniref:RING-type domain-containing protein n=1 Tax=Blepharisma stoltei TaxID=1481888 RepID=A0AAU9JQX3_9CILI|nr:unnamed protein product [Blepharisma stoltei]